MTSADTQRDTAADSPSNANANASANVTQLLQAASSGDKDDLNALVAAIYADLKRLAASQLQAERAEHTLQPTALVHEAYLRLIDQREVDWNDRGHFFAIASRLIRRILTDHARRRGAAKRGGGDVVTVLPDDVAAPDRTLDLVELDDALGELAELDQRQAQVVEMRYFGGMTIAEIAAALGAGKRSVDRDWQAAKAWLHFRLGGSEIEDGDGE